jgi:hypothetical protein
MSSQLVLYDGYTTAVTISLQYYAEDDDNN